MKRAAFLAAVGAAALASTLWALPAPQDAPSAKGDASQTSAPAPPPSPRPKPGAEMRKLIDSFSGVWSLVETYEPAEGMPEGAVGKSREAFRAGPGALSLVEEYRSMSNGGELAGMSVTWWDPSANGFRALWCSSSNATGCALMARLAHWEGDQFVLGDEFEKNGKRIVFKEVVSDITPTSFTQTIYQGEAGTEPKKIVTMKAKRVATTAPPKAPN